MGVLPNLLERYPTIKPAPITWDVAIYGTISRKASLWPPVKPSIPVRSMHNMMAGDWLGCVFDPTTGVTQHQLATDGLHRHPHTRSHAFPRQHIVQRAMNEGSGSASNPCLGSEVARESQQNNTAHQQTRRQERLEARSHRRDMTVRAYCTWGATAVACWSILDAIVANCWAKPPNDSSLASVRSLKLVTSRSAMLHDVFLSRNITRWGGMGRLNKTDQEFLPRRAGLGARREHTIVHAHDHRCLRALGACARRTRWSCSKIRMLLC